MSKLVFASWVSATEDTMEKLKQYRDGDWNFNEPEEPWTEATQEIVTGPRQASYGHALLNFLDLAIRDTMNKMRRKKLPFGVSFDPQDIIIFFDEHKLIREVNVHQDDNLIDLMGYTYSYQRIDAAMKQLGFAEGIQWFEGKRLYELAWLYEQLNPINRS